MGALSIPLMLCFLDQLNTPVLSLSFFFFNGEANPNHMALKMPCVKSTKLGPTRHAELGSFPPSLGGRAQVQVQVQVRMRSLAWGNRTGGAGPTLLGALGGTDSFSPVCSGTSSQPLGPCQPCNFKQISASLLVVAVLGPGLPHPS